MNNNKKKTSSYPPTSKKQNRLRWPSHSLHKSPLKLYLLGDFSLIHLKWTCLPPSKPPSPLSCFLSLYCEILPATVCASSYLPTYLLITDYIYIYIYIHIYIYKCVYVYIYMYVYTYICVYICIYLYQLLFVVFYFCNQDIKFMMTGNVSFFSSVSLEPVSVPRT